MSFDALRDHLRENRFIDRQSLKIRRDLNKLLRWLYHSFDWADNRRILTFYISKDFNSLFLLLGTRKHNCKIL